MECPGVMVARQPELVTSACTVVRRPHFRVRDGSAWFLVSRRPFRTMTADEQAVWAALEEPAGWLAVTSLGVGAESAVRSLWDSGMLELVEPRPIGPRRRVLVIEPHADDAVLSLGGTMWARRRETEFIIATVASRTNFTSYYYGGSAFFDPAVVTALRAKESALAAMLIGGEHRDLGMTDGPLRHSDGEWTEAFFRARRLSIAAATARRPDGAERQRWEAAISKLLGGEDFDEIWLPLGGPHADHRQTTESTVRVLAGLGEGGGSRGLSAACFYQEVPYAARFPEYTARALESLSRAGIEAVIEEEPIERSMEAKRRLVSLYASQFKWRAMERDVEACAESGSGKGRVERRWRCVGGTGATRGRGLDLRTSAEIREAERARAWMRRHAGASAVRVMLQAPSGRWDRDLGLIRRQFPRAAVEMWVSPDGLDEVLADCSGLEVRRLEKGGRAWLMTTMRLAFARGAPTLLLVGREKRAEATALSRLWLASDTLVIESLDVLHDAEERT